MTSSDFIGTPSNERSRRTRKALLDAAREILEQDGTEGLTLTAVASRAGVTRRTAYLHFGSRPAFVASLFDHLAEAEGLHESLERVWASPDSRAALDAWAAHLATYHPRLLAVDRAIERARHQDPDLEAHRQRVVAEKMRSARRLARWLDADGVLAPEWTTATAADMIFALISSDVIEALLGDRSWSRTKLRNHLSLLLHSTFVRP